MADKKKILIVDDDENIANLISLYLTKECFETHIEHDGESAIEAWKSFKPDLILLDIMLPGMDGYDVCRTIRKESNVPIIMLSAKTEVFDKVLGLELGADDYMVKPIDLDELLLRIEAILRRANISSSNKLSIGTFEMDEESMSVTLDGEEIPFTTKEFQLLFKLLSYPNHAFSRNQLLEELGGLDNESTPRSIDVFITNIRAKLEGCTSFKIVTVRGIGYKGVIQ